jgi:hypothetical protein
VIGSDRVLRLLCWSLIGFTIVTAVMQLTLSQNPFATPVPDGTDLVDRLLIYRSDETKVFPLSVVGAISGAGVYLIGALLGVVLRRLAPSGAGVDVMAVLFIVGGIVGVASQLMFLANSAYSTIGYCDCGYKATEVIAQDYALSSAWTVQLWVNTGALTIIGLAAAVAGRLVDLSRDWRILSYLIALGALVGVALRIAGAGPTSDIVIGIVAGIAVPIWAFLLARGSGRLAART